MFVCEYVCCVCNVWRCVNVHAPPTFMVHVLQHRLQHIAVVQAIPGDVTGGSPWGVLSSGDFRKPRSTARMKAVPWWEGTPHTYTAGIHGIESITEDQ